MATVVRESRLHKVRVVRRRMRRVAGNPMARPVNPHASAWPSASKYHYGRSGEA